MPAHESSSDRPSITDVTYIEGQRAEFQPLRPPTPKEVELLKVLCSHELSGGVGWPTMREIAQAVFLSENTPKTHRRSLYEKFDVKDLPDAQKIPVLIRRAIDSGWVYRDQ